MRNIHLPVWLGTPGLPRPATFVALFTLSLVPRTILLSVIPLTALSYLGDAQRVSLAYLSVSLAGLCVSLSIPWLVHRLRRRWVFTIGAVLMVLAALALAAGNLPAFLLAMVLQAFAMACLEITISLYVMDHVPRQELGHFEPRRIFAAAGAFVVGPWLGVTLQARVAEWLPFAIAGGAALCLLGYFWFLRLTENPAVAPMRKGPPSPLAYLRRFFVQPRLRLAWVLAVGRASWWSMFFIYAPIYTVKAGLGEELGGALVSIGVSAAFLVPLWAWVGRRVGLRRLLVAGYLASGLVTVLVALLAGFPWWGAAALVLAAVASSVIDGAGNLPFLRAVHPLERPAMTTVYGTYRDAAQLAPPGAFSLLLRLFELPVVFLAAGTAMLVLSFYARYIPRRL